EQHVVQRLATRLRRLNCYFQVVLNFVLANKLAQPLRAKLELKRRIVIDRRRRNNALVIGILFVRRRSHAGTMLKGNGEGRNEHGESATRLAGIDKLDPAVFEVTAVPGCERGAVGAGYGRNLSIQVAYRPALRTTACSDTRKVRSTAAFKPQDSF